MECLEAAFLKEETNDHYQIISKNVKNSLVMANFAVIDFSNVKPDPNHISFLAKEHIFPQV